MLARKREVFVVFLKFQRQLLADAELLSVVGACLEIRTHAAAIQTQMITRPDTDTTAMTQSWIGIDFLLHLNIVLLYRY